MMLKRYLEQRQVNLDSGRVITQKLVMDRLPSTSMFEKAVVSREKINKVIDTIRPEKQAIKREVTEQ